MKKVNSLIGILLIITTVNAQSPVGKWKLIIGVTETVAGKSTDLLKNSYEKEPCLKNVIYIFSADGKIITDADKCPDSTRKNLEASNLAIKWEISGNNKIKISTKDSDIDPVTYELTIGLDEHSIARGRRVMRWVLNFGDDPDISNPDEVVVLEFVYEELL